MGYQSQKVSLQFGSSLTSLGKQMLIIYASIYVVELICEHWIHFPVVSFLQVYPLNDPHFHLWQLVSHHFIQPPFSPISFLLSCLVFYFFESPIEQRMTPKGFLTLFYFSALGGVICGLIFGFLAGFDRPFMGMAPSIISMVVVFGLLNPEATILLMFILPVKAKYISYGTIAITVLTFLAKVNPDGAYQIGGILFGYIYPESVA